MPRLGFAAGDKKPGAAPQREESAGLASEALDQRNRRIAELERRFRELEENQAD